MNETMKEIWNGFVSGMEGYETNPEIRELEKLTARHYHALTDSISKGDRDTLEKYTDALREIEALATRNAFVYGLSLGLRLSGEAWTTDLS